jgi:hypothetical protein
MYHFEVCEKRHFSPGKCFSAVCLLGTAFLEPLQPHSGPVETGAYNTQSVTLESRRKEFVDLHFQP